MALLHDAQLWISTGRDRHEKSWKNKEMLWSELASRLSECVYTTETVKEYHTYDKPRQDRIKDVGGFVGGVVNGGRRVKGSITSRSVLTLDLDFAPVDFLDELEMITSNSFVLYSTHKHTPEVPRLRLVMPLVREVQADEYEALARLFSQWVGMDYLDPTSFQPERLMYYPSMPRDGKFYYHVADGPFLDPDYVLGRYRDWRDISQWPLHSSEREKVRTDVRQQADPLLKPGVIGAFCRTYGIAEVIEKYLASEYETTAQDDRFTYVHGSTAAGLVVYDNKFTYSHHSTDPSSGQLCNAFDLVRLHKFGNLDKNTKPGTATNKLPSFSAMNTLAIGDEAVKLLIGREKTAEALSDFLDLNVHFTGLVGESGDEWDMVTEEQIKENDDWLMDLKRDKRGQCISTIENVMLILENDALVRDRVRFNEFTCRRVIFGRMPWDTGKRKKSEWRVWQDEDDAGLRMYMEKFYEITGVNKIYDAVALVALRNTFHPVREFLQGLAWDGQERLETMLIDYMGAEDTPFVRAVSRKHMAAGVARVFQPGVKYDTMIVLIGPQGAAKSQFINRIGMQWYSESSGDIGSPRALEQLRGVWHMELAELAGLKKADEETIKHHLSKQVDEYRPAYGHHVGVFPRQNIFWGTSNKREINKDQTGGRRFWPVEVQESRNLVYGALDEATVCQLWAEAMQLYKAGETLYLSRDVEAQARELQQRHTEIDPRTESVRKYLEILLPEDWDQKNLYRRQAYIRGDETEGEGVVPRETITAQEIWQECFGGQMKDFTIHQGRSIHDLMRGIENWELKETKQRVEPYGVVRQYRRKMLP